MSSGPITKPITEDIDHAFIQLVTAAYVDQRKTPRECDIHRYHVWLWRGPVTEFNPPRGAKCRCGLLTM